MPNSKGFEMGIAQECQNLSLEQKLNKLIKKGWKPRGNKTEIGKFIVRKRGKSIERPQSQYMIYFYDKNDCCFMAYSLRELASKESKLWQFVCENGMVKHEVYEDIQSWEHTTAEHSDFWYTSGDNYEYRIIESALCKEEDLEKFLLDNIKIN